MQGQRFNFIDDYDREYAGVRFKDSVYPLDKLEFHISWDWLMPAIIKIENLGFRFKQCRTRVEIEYDKQPSIEGDYKIIVTKEVTKLKSAYVAVLKFIGWHKENNAVSER
jgi:hypothetical protein